VGELGVGGLLVVWPVRENVTCRKSEDTHQITARRRVKEEKEESETFRSSGTQEKKKIILKSTPNVSISNGGVALLLSFSIDSSYAIPLEIS
jgi:hypothetical protein